MHVNRSEWTQEYRSQRHHGGITPRFRAPVSPASSPILLPCRYQRMWFTLQPDDVKAENPSLVDSQILYERQNHSFDRYRRLSRPACFCVASIALMVVAEVSLCKQLNCISRRANFFPGTTRTQTRTWKLVGKPFVHVRVTPHDSGESVDRQLFRFRHIRWHLCWRFPLGLAFTSLNCKDTKVPTEPRPRRVTPRQARLHGGAGKHMSSEANVLGTRFTL